MTGRAKERPRNGLAEAIDRLGEIRARLHALKLNEKALTETVRDRLTRRKRPEADGARYHAEVIEAARLSVDLKALKGLAGRRILECVRPDVTAARKVLGAEAVEAIATTTTTQQVRVTERAVAARPIRHPGV